MSLPAEGSPVWLVLCYLASWRVTVLICYDEGPFDMFTRLRRMSAAVGLLRLVTCFHCTALWTSALIVLTLFEWRSTTILAVLGVAGATSITERWLGGGATTEPAEGSGDD